MGSESGGDAGNKPPNDGGGKQGGGRPNRRQGLGGLRPTPSHRNKDELAFDKLMNGLMFDICQTQAKQAEQYQKTIEQFKYVVGHEYNATVLRAIEELDPKQDLRKPSKPTGKYDEFDKIEYSKDYSDYKAREKEFQQGLDGAFNILHGSMTPAMKTQLTGMQGFEVAVKKAM